MEGSMNKILAWHWTNGRKLRDGTLLRVGRVYRLPEGQQPRMCDVGYHGSRRIIDALGYAPGAMLSRVELRGQIIEDTDKLCASERKVLWVLDCERLLHEFACACAERALRHERKAGREPDARSCEAVRIKRKWMTGKATDDELAAARDAARAAARDAAWYAAWDAAWAAAWAAAWDAAWAAAWDAARNAARDVEKAWQERSLRRAVGKARRPGR